LRDAEVESHCLENRLEEDEHEVRDRGVQNIVVEQERSQTTASENLPHDANCPAETQLLGSGFLVRLWFVKREQYHDPETRHARCDEPRIREVDASKIPTEDRCNGSNGQRR